MKTYLNKTIIILLGLVAFIFTACQEEDYQVGEIITPSNIQVNVTLEGQSAEFPNGDGSGVATINVTGDNALYYRIINGDIEIPAENGEATIYFSETGTFTYNLTAVAYGTGGVSDSLDFDVTVLVTYQAPQELLDKLYGDGSRTWRIKAETQGHFGLGPVDGGVPTEWYGAGPYDKEGVGMYDDRYTFNQDRTFFHETNGTIFGRVGLIDEIASGGDVDGADVYNAPYDSYTAQWALSAPAGVETISLSNNGFFGYYTGGDHKYRIFDRETPNELILSTTDGNGEFEWWFILTTEEVPAE